VLRVDAGFAIHGAKKDEVVRWLRGWGKEWDFERNETLSWLQGPPDPERSVSPAGYDKLSGETLSWETAETRCVARSPFAYTRSPETGREEGCSHRAPFLKLPDSFERDGWSTVWLTRGGRYVTLEVCNLAPYTISSALHYRSKSKEWNTEGSWSLEAGDCESFERNFQGVDPRFYVHASADGEVVRWLHDDAVVLSHTPQLKSPPFQSARNAPATINGRQYSGHALDQMQNRGLTPSVIENVIATGRRFPTRSGTAGFFDKANRLKVIVNSENGRVVTVVPGSP
jgi:hypothetical protein